MQLYALDEYRKVVFANHAKKHRNYTCFECQTSVRVRGGFHRQNHFFHIDAERSCRQNGKSMEHIQVQCLVQRTLPEDACVLEKRFPEINRIADAFWESEKLVFEIQCSPISAAEVKQRNQDYGKLGLSVVWIFHERQFKRWRLSAAEECLKHSAYYYTNVNSEGEGIIYDALHVIHRGKKIFISDPFPIAVAHPKRRGVKQTTNWPEAMRNRWDRKVYFGEDVFDSALCTDTLEELFRKVKILEGQFLELPKTGFVIFIRSFWRNFIVRPYRLVFQMLLESASA